MTQTHLRMKDCRITSSEATTPCTSGKYSFSLATQLAACSTHSREVLINRYLIIQKLGWGHFSTVWLAKDIQYNTFVALKIQRSASHYLVAAFDEVEILDQVASYWIKPAWLNALKTYYKNEPEKL